MCVISNGKIWKRILFFLFSCHHFGLSKKKKTPVFIKQKSKLNHYFCLVSKGNFVSFWFVLFCLTVGDHNSIDNRVISLLRISHALTIKKDKVLGLYFTLTFSCDFLAGFEVFLGYTNCLWPSTELCSRPVKFRILRMNIENCCCKKKKNSVTMPIL